LIGGPDRDRTDDLLHAISATQLIAILALLLGCGLRRTELVSEVKVGAIAQNRWVLVDITGKENRVRSVGVPAWVKAAIDEWTTATAITEGQIFRAVRKGGKIWARISRRAQCCRSFSSTPARWVSKSWRPMTCAEPAPSSAASGGDLEQIKFLLGYASIQTTERYLGAEQDFISAVNDNLGLER
jgi:site-specific recombinase XerC